jgi:SAM-dependent methyltransferase
VKSSTDLHWDERAQSVKDDAEVNLMDVFQRNLEYDSVCSYLSSEMRVLEVGCGNGYSTERFRDCAAHVDAFDYSEAMLARAKERVGETNNRFLCDNVLDPKHLEGPYDAIVCVRVLINLRDLAEQQKAISNLVPLLQPKGILVLAEGFWEGFEGLNELRSQVDLPEIQPAKINYYSSLSELKPLLDEHFDLEDEFHLGGYDYLTRVVFPLLVGADQVKHNTVVSEKFHHLARAFNPDAFQGLSRMRGLVLKKKAVG